MASAQDFYIQPAGRGFGAGLSGLGDILAENRERKAQQQAAQQAEQAVMDAMRSGDPDLIAEASLAYPQYAEAIDKSLGIGGTIRERQREDEKRYYQDVLASPEKAKEITTARLQMLQQMGRDGQDTQGLLEEFMNPETAPQAMKTIENMYALRYPDEYQSYRQATAPEEVSGEGEGLADQRERKIAQYMENFGMDRQQAIRAVDSNIMLDDRGNVISFDPTTGTGELVDIDVGDEPPTIQAPTGTAVEDLAFDPSKGTGFGRSFLGLWNRTLGQIPFAPVAEETEEAAQNLRLIERDAINALASSGRPPVVEQQRIAALVPDAMNFLENPQVAQFKLTNFVDLMMNQYVDDLRYQQDRRNPKNVREESAARANRIESVMRRVLKPEAADAMFDSVKNIETQIGDIQQMPVEELLQVDPANLTDAEFDIYMQRLEEL